MFMYAANLRHLWGRIYSHVVGAGMQTVPAYVACTGWCTFDMVIGLTASAQREDKHESGSEATGVTPYNLNGKILRSR
jgi:hypothetical protein